MEQVPSSLKTATARQVIDTAIKENRFWERLIYIFAITFVLIGITLIAISIINKNVISGVLGWVSSALFIPAMESARRTRKENIAIRLLEVPLSNASTAEEAATALNTQGYFILDKARMCR